MTFGERGEKFHTDDVSFPKSGMYFRIDRFYMTSRRPYSCIGELKQRRRNKNGRKAIGLDWQNKNFARASRFLVHFFAVTSRLRRETS